MNPVRASAWMRGIAAIATVWSSGCATEASGPAGNGAAVDDDPCHEAVCVRVGRCAAGQSSAQFQRQAMLPAMVRPSTRMNASVTYTNCSGEPWTADAFALHPARDEDGLAWGIRRVALPATVADGNEVTFRFEMQAPLTAGRYPVRWAIAHEGVEVYQEPSPAQMVEVLASADCAQAGAPIRYRAQMPPGPFLAVGEHVPASVTFANCSTSTLSRDDGWSLASRGDPADAWGDARIELPGDVPSGAEVTFPIDLRAPSQPGRYRFAWQITHRDESVGETSPAVWSTVLRPADCDNAHGPARFVSHDVPPEVLDPAQAFGARVTYANCSDHIWDSTYRLDTALDGDARIWGAGPVALPLTVAPGFSVDIPFRVTAPVTPGRYPYRWTMVGPSGRIDDATPALERTVRCIPHCGDHNCGGDGCGGSCGGCAAGWSCDGAHCQLPDRPVCGELQWWNTYITYEHISYGWHDTDLGVRADTRVQLRHTSRLERTGVYDWGYMPEFTDLATGARFRMLHLRPQHQWATEVGRVYPAGYVVGLSGGDTRDTGLPVYSTGQHLCIQTLRTYRDAFPRGDDACR